MLLENKKKYNEKEGLNNIELFHIYGDKSR